MLICFLSFYVGFTVELPTSTSKAEFNLLNKNPDDWSRFTLILVNNLKVGILIVSLGLISGGMGSIIVITLNGYSFGLLVNNLFSYYENPFQVISIYVLPHAFTEVLAFCLCGCVGFKGFFLAKEMIKSNEIPLRFLPKRNELLIPLFLFIISALIETFISSGSYLT